MKKPLPKPDRVEVRPASYQPKKSEKEQRWRIKDGATPQEVARKVQRPVELVDKSD